MKKLFWISMALLVFTAASGFALHKFYMSIYQIDYAPEKKRLQITSRVFIDDLNHAVSQECRQQTHLGEKEETPQDLVLLQKYFAGHFFLKVNGQAKKMQFLSKERDENVIVCYFRIDGVAKVSTLEINNSALTEAFSEQQNMVQVKIGGQKQTLMLKDGEVKGMLKF